MVEQSCGSGFHHTACFLPDAVVPFAMRDHICGAAGRIISAPFEALEAAVQRPSGRTGQRAHADRPRVARHAAAKFSWAFAPHSDGLQPSAVTAGKRAESTRGGARSWGGGNHGGARHGPGAAIAALSEELRAAPAEGRSPAVEVEVEGQARELQPIQRDEIYRITGEALRNAFRHAQAARIDVAIRHGDHEFRITVKDDGKGIAPEILQQGGRRDHWGLPGMRERAEAMGAELDVWSSTGN